MTLFASSRPGLRARALLRWPASLLGGAGISWAFASGEATASLDFASLSALASISDASKLQLAVLDADTGSYERLRADTLIGSVAGDQRTGVSDAAYAILNSDRYVALTATLTAARVWTLPAASTVAAGRDLVIADDAGGVTSANKITITASGTDTINGSGTFALDVTRGAVRLRCNGSNKWTIVGLATPTPLVTSLRANMHSPHGQCRLNYTSASGIQLD